LQQPQLATPATDGLVGKPDHQQQDNQHHDDREYKLLVHQAECKQVAYRKDRIRIYALPGDKSKGEPKE